LHALDGGPENVYENRPKVGASHPYKVLIIGEQCRQLIAEYRKDQEEERSDQNAEEDGNPRVLLASLNLVHTDTITHQPTGRECNTRGNQSREVFDLCYNHLNRDLINA